MDPVSSRGFNLLGMNIGANERDYTLLHEQVKVEDSDTVNSLLNQYHEAKAEEKGPIEEKLFHILQDHRRPVEIDPQNDELAGLIIEKGLDILEVRIEDPAFKELINAHTDMLGAFLAERIKDNEGAKQLKKMCPNLCNYLKDNYNSQLPKPLKKTVWERVKSFFQKKPSATQGEHRPTISPLNQQLLTVKQRLAENFFRTVISSSEKPAVISLQEVYRNNNGVLKILKEGNYEVFRGHDGDTAIALDRDRFAWQFLDQISTKNAVVYAKDKETNEEFVFISAHIPGYKLEFPENATPEEMEIHLKNVQGYIETGAFEAIRELNSAIAQLKQSYPNLKVVIQGDFNTYPEYFEDPRVNDDIRVMNLFEKMRENHFDLVRTGQATELNRSADGLPERELDYVFADHTLEGRVKVLDLENQELALANILTQSEDESNSEASTEEELTSSEEIEDSTVHFDPMLLFSDHRPLWMKISGKRE